MARILSLPLLAVSMIAVPAHAERFTADAVHFEDITATVEIVTNGGDIVDVAVSQGSQFSSVTVTQDQDGTVRLKGEPWREEDLRDCCNDRIRRTVSLRNERDLSTGDKIDKDFFAQYPTIKVTMPRKADATFIDARMNINMSDLDGALHLDACYAYGEIGDAETAIVNIVSGSRLVLGDVGAMMELDLSGDADLLAGDAAMADIDIAGPGDVVLGSVDGMMDVSIAGSGAVRASRLTGSFAARIAGSGSVSVQSGRAEEMTATIDGSGGVYFNGTAVAPDLRLHGSAEVELSAVSGRVRHVGTGSVYVRGEKLDR